MNTIQSNSQIYNIRSPCTQITPIMIIFKLSILYMVPREERRYILKSTRLYRLPQSQKCSTHQTNCQNTSHWISSTLMSKNFSRRNIKKHNNEQKQNSQCSNIYQQLQQYKILKPLQYKKPGTVQKQLDQIKYRMYRVFRSHHQKYAHQSPSSYQSKRLTHLFFMYEEKISPKVKH